MRFLFLTADYRAFLDALYAGDDGLASRSYDDQLAARYASRFGVADFYSQALRELGHEAEDVYANNEPLQRAWARERLGREPRAATRAERALRRLLRAPRAPGWFEEVLLARVAADRPDVLVNQDPVNVGPELTRALRQHARLVVGMHNATPLPGDLAGYDLFVTAYGPTREALEARGIPAAYLPMAFDPRVLEAAATAEPDVDVSFVGSLFPNVHRSRIELLERLCERVPALEVWTPSIDGLSPGSPLRERHRGPAWGRTMYEVLRRSKVTLNHHGDPAPFAHNCRLFEATGTGAALLTDRLPNLDTLYEEGTEVAAFSDVAECASRIEELLDGPEKRAELARRGQQRTLRDHTYRDRVLHLVELVEPLL